MEGVRSCTGLAVSKENVNFSHLHSRVQPWLPSVSGLISSFSLCITGIDLSISPQSSPVLRRTSCVAGSQDLQPLRRGLLGGLHRGAGPHCSSPSQAVSRCQHEVLTHEETPTVVRFPRSLELKKRHVGTGVWLGLVAPDDFP